MEDAAKIALGLVAYKVLYSKITADTPGVITPKTVYDAGLDVVSDVNGYDPGLDPGNGNGLDGNGLEPAGPQPTGPEYVEAYPDNTCPVGYTPERVTQQYWVCHRSDLV